MLKKDLKLLSWDFFARLVIICFAMMQAIKWSILPQYMDIYYHLLTAWGFNQAGGYVTWDFWQYAPVGRPHIYPPFFHLLLANLMKAGISPVILAKLCESIIPVIFLILLWRFARRNFDSKLSFFILIMTFSSFSFYSSLLNHLPGALGLIFAILALDQLLRARLLQSGLLLALCFYTHIGVSWFLAISIIFYGLLDSNRRYMSFLTVICGVVLALPILVMQLANFNNIGNLGFEIIERYRSQIKIIDYLLAGYALFLIFKEKRKNLIFAALFFGSLIFLLYPYRFFSAEGYLPIIFLSALSLSALLERLKDKKYFKFAAICTVSFFLFISPTIYLDKPLVSDKTECKIRFFDSAFLGMLLQRGERIWYPREYLPLAGFIRNNSTSKEIVYSTSNLVGVIIAAIAQRPTANALFQEIKTPSDFNPFLSSKIIIFSILDKEAVVGSAVKTYGLKKIGETSAFRIYINPYCTKSYNKINACVPFWAISALILMFILIFFILQKVMSNKLCKFF
ncbi:MAG: hypothetical protein DRP74_04050 [Candidatus Omnitrophota bacterium]|nr:MAG: hypothetical protein DRP74_04050 [Candidatus Omnitrophota bacterium]